MLAAMNVMRLIISTRMAVPLLLTRLCEWLISRRHVEWNMVVAIFKKGSQ